MSEVCVIILNYRRAALTIEALASLRTEVEGHDNRSVVVIDNASGDGSADEIEAAINANSWDGWAELVRSPVNGGFAAGNNLGFSTVPAEHYLLLNSDSRATPGMVDGLLTRAREDNRAGIIGPRLTGPNGDAQVSVFRYRSPVSEFLAAAGTGILDRLLSGFIVGVGIPDESCPAQWVSFACVLVRRRMIDEIGPMDDGYFMYFEDIDYARTAARAGWRSVYEPAVSAIHLRGGTSSVKSAMKERSRVPRYYYESRSRYYAKFYGGQAGVIIANLMWLAGRSIAATREWLGSKKPHACTGEWRDNWIAWRTGRRAPVTGRAAE